LIQSQSKKIDWISPSIVVLELRIENDRILLAYYSPIILRHVWWCKKVSYYPNVMCLGKVTRLVSNVVLSRFFKETAYLNVKCQFVYMTKIGT
jgi:hypothetical protein